MLHDPTTFGRASNDNRAGWQLRAIAKRRREARNAALTAAAAALCFAIGTAFAIELGSTGGAAVLAISTAVALYIGIVAASEA